MLVVKFPISWGKSQGVETLAVTKAYTTEELRSMIVAWSRKIY